MARSFRTYVNSVYMVIQLIESVVGCFYLIYSDTKFHTLQLTTTNLKFNILKIEFAFLKSTLLCHIIF